jgi:glycosyltransferase involved in cell wall biosynthesis
VREIALGLERLGDEVTVLVPHAPGLPVEWSDAGLRVRSFRYAPERCELLGYGRSLASDERVRGGAGWVAPLYALSVRGAVRRELLRARYDLVHAHWLVPNAVALVAAGLGVPLAVGLHGSDVFLAEKLPFRWASRWALRGTRLLTGCSPELVDRVCALGFPRERARVIPYGVDIATFSPAPERRGIWRARLGIPPEAPVLLGVGRMVTKKGFQHLLEILPRLRARQPDLHIVLAGGGDRLEEFRAAARASEPSGPPTVHFPGAVLRDALPDLFRAADVFVLPAVHDASGNVDGLPNVILEAMASGLPVVASGISGIPLAVVEGETGTLVPEGDAPALALALERLLADRALCARMGQRGRERAVARLTWDAVAAEYRQSYLDVACGREP